MKQLSFKQYRNIDIFMLCLFTAIFEAIATFATIDWFALQAMAISITLAMVCIALMRWNGLAVIPALVGSFVYCVVSKATLQQFIVYCGACIFVLLALLPIKLLKKDRIRTNFVIRSVFVLATYLYIVLGRWICSLIFQPSLKSLLVFMTTDILSLVFAILVMTVVKNGDGLIEDQKSYLLRLDKERKENQFANLNDPF